MEQQKIREGQSHILLCPTRTGTRVEMVRFEKEICSGGYSHGFQRYVQRIITASEFLRAVVSESVMKAARKTVARQVADIAVAKISSSENERGVLRFIAAVGRLFTRRIRAAVTAEAEKLASQKRTRQLLEEVSSGRLLAFGQRIEYNANGVFSGLIDQFEAKHEERVRQIIAEKVGVGGAHDLADNQAPFPQGTKFFFQRDGVTLLVIEQPPQTRTIRFATEFLKNETENADEDPEKAPWKEKIARGMVHLAFPYAVFMVKIKEGALDDLSVYYTTKPLTSLEDALFSCNMPNQMDSVCLDAFHPGDEENLMRLAEMAVSYFWESWFNNDYPLAYDTMRERDGRFDSVWEWELASRDNPSFVLEVHWLKSGNLAEKVNEVFPKSNQQPPQIAMDVLQRARHKLMQEVSQACDPKTLPARYPENAQRALERYLERDAMALAAVVEREIAALVLERDGPISSTITRTLGRIVRNLIAQTISQALPKQLAKVTGDTVRSTPLSVRALVKKFGGRIN